MEKALVYRVGEVVEGQGRERRVRSVSGLSGLLSSFLSCFPGVGVVDGDIVGGESDSTGVAIDTPLSSGLFHRSVVSTLSTVLLGVGG